VRKINKIPGYKSMTAFAKVHNMSDDTVRGHMLKGYCSWPMVTPNAITKDAAYKCWNAIIQRTTNPNDPSAQHYSLRGITVCPRWRVSFAWFLEDMGPRPGPEYSVDRINNDGNYDPGNCRWATATQQAHNTQKTSIKRGHIQTNPTGRYQGQVRINRKLVACGTYDTKEEAQQAINNKLQEVPSATNETHK